MSDSDRQILDAFIDNIWIEKGLSQNTLDSYRSDLEQFSSWLEKNKLSYINTSKKEINELAACASKFAQIQSSFWNACHPNLAAWGALQCSAMLQSSF